MIKFFYVSYIYVILLWTEKSDLKGFNETQGEAGAVNLESVHNYRVDILNPLLAEYGEDDIFNVDETGLFWKVLPNKTLTFKGDKCTNGKKSKERITVLVGSNMSGTEKVPLFVIGKSLKLRCSKNAKLPLEYDANKKAWMTGFDTLRKYVEENASDSKTMEMCNYFEEFLYFEQRKKAVQTTIDQLLAE